MTTKFKKFKEDHRDDIMFYAGATCATIGAVAAIKLLQFRGYKMVRPDGRTEDGRVIVRELFGNRWTVNFDN